MVLGPATVPDLSSVRIHDAQAVLVVLDAHSGLDVVHK